MIVEGPTNSNFSFWNFLKSIWRFLNSVMLLGILLLVAKHEFIDSKRTVPQMTFNLTPAQLDQIKVVVAESSPKNSSVDFDPVLAKMTELQSNATAANFDFFIESLVKGIKMESGGKEVTYKLKVVEQGTSRLLQLVAEQ